MENIAPERNVLRILFLASEPRNLGNLRLGSELQEIRNRLAVNAHFEIKDRQAVKPDDVLQTILNYKPHIVHFSGHGEDDGGICFEDEVGTSKVIPPDALSSLFNLVTDYVKCVIVNTCYSETQAKAIAQHVPIVIGTSKEITDSAAIKFSTGFYTALEPDLSQNSLKKAFSSGCIAIQFESLPENLTPIIIEGSPEIRFSSEVDTAFLPIAKPKGLAFKALIRGLTLTGIKMGLPEPTVAKILEEKVSKLELHNSSVLEYEGYFKDILRDEFPLSEQSSLALLHLQNGLGLSNQVVTSIKNKVLSDPNLNTPEKWYDRGKGQSDLGNYEKAIEYFSIAIEKDPDYSGAYFERGFNRHLLKDYAVAIEDFTKAIEYNNKWEFSSNLSQAYYKRAHAYFSIPTENEQQKEADMQRALDDWNKSIELYPNEPNAFYNIGLVHQYFNDFENAVVAFKKSYDLTKDEKTRANTAYSIVKSYRILNNIEEANKWTQIALGSTDKKKTPDQVPETQAEEH